MSVICPVCGGNPAEHPEKPEPLRRLREIRAEARDALFAVNDDVIAVMTRAELLEALGERDATPEERACGIVSVSL